MSDSIALQKAKDYVNIRQFVKECRRRWGMDKEVAKEEWKTLLADPKVPKSEDERGWVTMPALSSVKSGPKILMSQLLLNSRMSIYRFIYIYSYLVFGMVLDCYRSLAPILKGRLGSANWLTSLA